jgi:hypothetical protein
MSRKVWCEVNNDLWRDFVAKARRDGVVDYTGHVNSSTAMNALLAHYVSAPEVRLTPKSAYKYPGLNYLIKRLSTGLSIEWDTEDTALLDTLTVTFDPARLELADKTIQTRHDLVNLVAQEALRGRSPLPAVPGEPAPTAGVKAMADIADLVVTTLKAWHVQGLV